MATAKRTPALAEIQPKPARPLAGCRKCRPASTESQTCVRCLDREKRRRDDRAADGLCVICPNISTDGRRLCAACRTKNRARVNRNNRDVKLRVMARYGGRCACTGCGETTIEFLSIDHINGGGNRHRRELANNRQIPGTKEYRVRGGVNFYRWLERSGFPEGYRVLCFNCNLARGFCGYCPHERREASPA